MVQVSEKESDSMYRSLLDFFLGGDVSFNYIFEGLNS